MAQRTACVLLVLTLLSSGASAPFAHVHPPGHDHAGGEAPAGEHDARRDWHGIHWHQGERGESGTPDAGIGERVAVAAAVAAEAPPAGPDAAPVPAEALPSTAVCDPASRIAPAAACADPDPPPRTRRSTRAPPLPR